METGSYQIISVALELLGEPNRKLSNECKWRYGSNGSLEVDLQKNCFYDFEEEKGGGVLELICREKGGNKSEAARWYRDQTDGGRGLSTQLDHTAPMGIQSRVADEHIYTDEEYSPLVKVIRYAPKAFKQQHWGGHTWKWGNPLKKPLLYRLPKVLEAINANQVVYIVEGEKDVETMEELDLVASCNLGGAGKWKAEVSSYFRNAEVVVIPDNDIAGKKHAHAIAASLLDNHCKVKLLNMPGLAEKEDVSDWFAKGGSRESLIELTSKCKTHSKKAYLECGVYSEVVFTKASDITPEKIRWLWPDHLAKGKLHILAGPAGLGKTTMALSFAASVSGGTEFPDGKASPKKGRVIIWSGEDTAGDTIVPRLIAAGACLENIYIIGGYQEGEELQAFDPAAHIHELEKKVDSIGGADMLIIDPIVSAVRGDSHKANDVRRSLQPIVHFAEKYNCAVLGITHFAKGTKGIDPQERVIGSQAFAALARTVFVCAKSDDSTQRIFTKAKSNISPDGGGFYYDLEQYHLIDHQIIASRVVWGESVEGSGAEVLSLVESAECNSAKTATEEALAMLLSILANGEMESSSVKKILQEEGFSQKVIRSAREKCGVEMRRTGSGKNMKTFWRLNNHSCPQPPFVPKITTREIGAPMEIEGTNGAQLSSGEESEEFEI